MEGPDLHGLRAHLVGHSPAHIADGSCRLLAYAEVLLRAGTCGSI